MWKIKNLIDFLKYKSKSPLSIDKDFIIPSVIPYNRHSWDIMENVHYNDNLARRRAKIK